MAVGRKRMLGHWAGARYEFSMRPMSHSMLVALPAILAILLVLLVASPLNSAFALAPNVAWVMTLVVVGFYPPAWPRGFAFFIGLLQDVVFATPLGAQAILTLILAQLALAQSHRTQVQLFRMRWLEAAGALILWHGLLWLLLHAVNHDSASLKALVRTGIISALWYPILYFIVTRLTAALPDGK